VFAKKKTYKPTDVLECEICCLSLPKAMMTGLECGHLYCTACWTEYLTTKIMDEGASQMIECPGSCKIVVNDQTVMQLITDGRVKLKYQHLITNSFVQCNRWGRSEGSVTHPPQAAPVVPEPRLQQRRQGPGGRDLPTGHDLNPPQHVEAKPVKCGCGHSFCFACRYASDTALLTDGRHLMRSVPLVRTGTTRCAAT
jgi:ariadne-1